MDDELAEQILKNQIIIMDTIVMHARAAVKPGDYLELHDKRELAKTESQRLLDGRELDKAKEK